MVGGVLLLVLSGCSGPRVASVPAIDASAEPVAKAPLVEPAPTFVRGAYGFGSAFAPSAHAVDEGDAVVARVAGLEIRKHHVFDRLQEVDPQRTREILEVVLLDARVRERSRVLGVAVPETDLDLAVRREWSRVERGFHQRPDGAASLQDYVRRNYAMSTDAFRARVRLLAWRRLMRAYTLRYEVSRRGRLRLLWLFNEDESVVRSCHDRIAAGADFSVLAREHGSDRTRRVGGRLPELPLGYPHPAVRLSKTLAVGQLSEVHSVQAPDGRKGFAFVRLRERNAPDRRPFTEQVRQLRRGLDRRPVDAAEIAMFLQARSASW